MFAHNGDIEKAHFCHDLIVFARARQHCTHSLGRVDWVVVLCPTRHEIGHFRDVPQTNVLAWYGKTKPNTTKAHSHQSKEMYCNTKKLKPRLVAFHDIRPGNGDDLFWTRCFINVSLTYLDTYPLTAPGSAWGYCEETELASPITSVTFVNDCVAGDEEVCNPWLRC